jgi:hypothetical protein
MLLLLGCTFSSCRSSEPTLSEPVVEEEEALARTEFTDRIENFFEYAPLHVGKPSQFRIHLTDLSDGSPVEKAEVTLTVRLPKNPATVAETTAKVGKVTGISVAELTLSRPGAYEIEFRIKNAKLDERMVLDGFMTE